MRTEYYWFGMVILYGSSIASGLGAICSLILPKEYVDADRATTAAIFALFSLVAGLLGRASSNMMNYAAKLASEREFLVVFDYGTGGVWAFATAGSEAEIKKVFPELTVVADIPAWMTPEKEQTIRMDSSPVVSDPTTYPKWLRTMVRDRRS